MFWRKTREAIGRFHPEHQRLTMERIASVSAPAAAWEELLASLAQHEGLVKRRKWRLPPRTKNVLVPLVRVLSEDVTKDGAIGINADLRGPDAPGKAGPGRDLPVRRPIRKATEWFVVDPWLQARAELRDGSVLELSVTDRIRYRKIHKVNPRGKHKTKTKTKLVQRIEARRTLPVDGATWRPDAPPPPWIRVRTKEGKRTVLSATAKIPPAIGEMEIQAILTVVTELFRWTPPDAVRRTA